MPIGCVIVHDVDDALHPALVDLVHERTERHATVVPVLIEAEIDDLIVVELPTALTRGARPRPS